METNRFGTYIVLMFDHLRINWGIYLITIINFILLLGCTKYNKEITEFMVEKCETVIIPYFLNPFLNPFLIIFTFYANLVERFMDWYDPLC